MVKKLPSIWSVNHRDPKAKEDYENIIRNSTIVRERLAQILNSYLNEIEDSELNNSFFEKPNVVERIAFNRGKKRALRDILTLISF